MQSKNYSLKKEVKILSSHVIIKKISQSDFSIGSPEKTFYDKIELTTNFCTPITCNWHQSYELNQNASTSGKK